MTIFDLFTGLHYHFLNFSSVLDTLVLTTAAMAAVIPIVVVDSFLGPTKVDRNKDFFTNVSTGPLKKRYKTTQ